MGDVLARLFLAQLAALPGCPPGLLLCLPAAGRPGYQSLLYGAAARHGWAVAGIRRLADLDRVSWPGPIVVHAHWFGSLFNGAQDAAEAAAQLEAGQGALDRFQARTGARALWTAHNLWPHDRRFPETYRALRRWICDRFDAVHVLSDQHLPLLEAAYGRRLPAPFAVPHMTYDGVAAPTPDRVAARAALGLPADALVVGVFGALLDYKRLDVLLAAMDLVAMGRSAPTILLAAGSPGPDGAARRLAGRTDADGPTRLRLIARAVSETEIAAIHGASDIMAVPHGSGLNSGAAMMALTHRRPLLLPDGPLRAGLADLELPPGCGETPSAMAEELRRLERDGVGQRWDKIGPSGEGGGAIGRADRALSLRAPTIVSEAFMTCLDRIASR